MSYVPCHFFGSKQLSEITDSFSAALTSWSQHWAGGRHNVIVSCMPARIASADEVAGSEPWIALNAENEAVGWVRFDAGGSSSILEYLSKGAGELEPRAQGYGEKLGDKILLDLLRRLPPLKSISSASMEHGVEPPPVANIRWSGWVVAPISVGSIRLQCVLPPHTAKGFLQSWTPESGQSRPLERLEYAFQDALMPIDIRLCATEGLSVNDLDELAVGSVVVLGRFPNVQWTVFGPDESELAPCKIGRLGDRFAVQWAALKIIEENT